MQAHVGGDPLFAENLFRFGDKDGSGTNALLQHPLAVLALTDGSVIVADSYNHRLKVQKSLSNTCMCHEHFAARTNCHPPPPKCKLIVRSISCTPGFKA